jgi:hypothetical protein
MKSKSTILILLILMFQYTYCQETEKRPIVNFKLGISMNRVFEVGDEFALFTNDHYTNGICTQEKYTLKPNIRMEVNFFITKWLELGLYGGYFEYNAYNVTFIDSLPTINYIKTYAPTFGINCNFHILELLKLSNLKNLDLYYIFKYGGTILPKWGGDFEYPIPDFWADPIFSKYRSSYCFGLGAGYSIWKKLGLYSELTFGKHSYFPDIDLKSHISFRAGVFLSI